MVLDSALWMLTMAAVVLLVPAFAALLGIERHRHLAALEDTSRRVRLVVAATLVGLGALGASALLDGEPLVGVIVAVVLAGSVLAWAPMSSTWEVRGIVVWALLVTGSVAFLSWLVRRTVASDMDLAQLVVTAAAGLLLVLVLARGQHYVRQSIGAHAGLEDGSGRAPIPVVRPLGTLAALLAAGGVVVAVAEDAPAPDTPSPQSGGTPAGTLSAGTTGPRTPSSAPTPTIGLAPSEPSTVDAAILPGMTPVRGGIRATTAGLAPSAPVGVPVVSAPTGVGGGLPSSGPVVPGVQGPMPRDGGARPTRPPTAGPGGGSDGSGDGTSSGGTGAGSGSGGTGSGGTGAGSGSGGTGSGGVPDPGTGGTDEPDVVVDIRPRGYAKEKPHRPSDAPSPGHGRLNHLAEPSPVPPGTRYAPPPTLIPVPSPTPLLPSMAMASPLPPEPTRTPGWAKKPHRPKSRP